MRRFFITAVVSIAAAGAVFAADIPPAPPPVRAPAVYLPAPPVYNWGGLYFGLNAGGAWVDQPGPSFTNATTGAPIGTTSSAANSTGFAGGGQIGFNYQINQLVLGAEVDADYLSNKTTLNGSEIIGGNPSTFTHTYQLDLLSTVRGRVGLAVDRALFYGTAGLAMGGFKATRTENACVAGSCPGTSVPGTNETYNKLRLGWTAGAGV